MKSQAITPENFAKLTRPQKASVIRQLASEGLSQADIAAALKIDRTTVYRICRRPHEVSRVRRTEGGRPKLNTRQVRMLIYSIHDRVPAEARWTKAAKAKMTGIERWQLSQREWTTGVIRAIISDRYPDAYESHCDLKIFRRFIRDKLKLVQVHNNWGQQNDDTSNL